MGEATIANLEKGGVMDEDMPDAQGEANEEPDVTPKIDPDDEPVATEEEDDDPESHMGEEAES